MNYLDEVAIDTLARTLWGEARNQGRAGIEAVASVILNRVAHPSWWGKDVVSVCRAKKQFSCWNDDDVNRPLMLKVGARGNPSFVTCLDVAQRAVTGNLRDNTGGADSYFNPAVVHPNWTERAHFCCRIGAHEFWRVQNPAPSGEPEAPTVSADQLTEADRLNDAEAARIRNQ